jgi:AraC-like DNA-binding protein
MKTSLKPEPTWRIAVVTFLPQMDAQHSLDGIYRAGERDPRVWIRQFDEEAGDFRREVLTPLSEWKPHGVIVRMAELDRLRKLRNCFPSIPFVSMLLAPPEIVQTMVVGNLMDALTTCRDYFLHCGLSHVAIYCSSMELAVSSVVATFRKVVPDGLELLHPDHVVDARTPAEKRRQRKVMTDVLLGLPKPVGIVTMETTAAPLILQWCHTLGLRVPEDVQIIGVDEGDLCFGCDPRLTSYVPPNRRIGEAALEAMLRLLRREQPPPAPIVRVSGGIIIPRGSTALQGVGRDAVACAIDRMQAHAAKGLTAADITRLSKVGHNTFYKQFGAVTGNTPARYLRQLRIEEARRLLRETDDTVKAVGKACGFKSMGSFANFFLRQTGQSPTAYRKRLTGNKKKAPAGKTAKRGCSTESTAAW